MTILREGKLVEIHNKATCIDLFSLKTPQMRAFHMTWFAFFLCFFGWFGIAPLMAIVCEDLMLTKAQIGNTIIASVRGRFIFPRPFQSRCRNRRDHCGSLWLNEHFCPHAGRVFSDRFAKSHGLKGRVWLLGIVLFLESIALVIFSRMPVLGIAVIATIIFSLFVQMSGGATYGIVPFINKRLVGPVAGAATTRTKSDHDAHLRLLLHGLRIGYPSSTGQSGEYVADYKRCRQPRYGLSQRLGSSHPLNAPDRATTPIWRDSNGRLRPVDWPTALNTFVTRMKEIQRRHAKRPSPFSVRGSCEHINFLLREVQLSPPT
jgi:hypothetical protein